MRRFFTYSLLALALAACSGRGTGQVEVRLTNQASISTAAASTTDAAPAPALAQVVVTIDRVEANLEDKGWQTLVAKTMTIDLMALKGGSFTVLGIAELPAGHIEQLRLHIVETGPNYAITTDGVRHDLKIPSGTESGIKIVVADLEVEECERAIITLDFNAEVSVVAHATADDGWILRPVVQLRSVDQGADDQCEEQEATEANERGEVK